MSQKHRFGVRGQRFFPVNDNQNSLFCVHEIAAVASFPQPVAAAFSLLRNHRTVGRSASVNFQTRVPARALPASETSFYTIDELERVLPALDLPARAAVAVAGYVGLRLAEIQGLTRADHDGGTLTVRETQWRGHRSPPKSRVSGCSVPVPQLRSILDRTARRSKTPARYSGRVGPCRSARGSDRHEAVLGFAGSAGTRSVEESQYVVPAGSL